MPDKMILPKFASEAEEAQWWFDHSEDVAKAFEEAAEARTLRTGSAGALARKEHPAAGNATISLDPKDISRARALAAQRGLHYQAFLQMLVHEALEAEEKKLAS